MAKSRAKKDSIYNPNSYYGISSSELKKRLEQLWGALRERTQDDGAPEGVESIAALLINDNIIKLDSGLGNINVICCCNINVICCCLVDVLRLTAPQPPYGDQSLLKVFKLFIKGLDEMLESENDHHYLYFLEQFSTYQCCLLLHPIGDEKLVLNLFQKLLVQLSCDLAEHHRKVFRWVVSIIGAYCVEDEVPAPVWKMLFGFLTPPLCNQQPSGKDAVKAVLENHQLQMKDGVSDYLKLCLNFFEKEEGVLSVKQTFTVIRELAETEMSYVTNVLPNISTLMIAEDPDLRLKALKFVGDLFTLPPPGRHAVLVSPEKDVHLFHDLLNRFVDKMDEVRYQAISYGVKILGTPCSNALVTEIIAKLEGRLLDPNEKIRAAAIRGLGEGMLADESLVTSHRVDSLLDRLRDKQPSVRDEAVSRIAKVYKKYGHIYGRHADENRRKLSRCVASIPDAFTRATDVVIDPRPRNSRCDIRERVEQLLEGELFSDNFEEQVEGLAFYFQSLSEESKNMFARILMEKRVLMENLAELVAARKEKVPATLGSKKENLKLKAATREVANCVLLPLDETKILQGVKFFAETNQSRVMTLLQTLSSPTEDYDSTITARKALLKLSMGTSSVVVKHIISRAGMVLVGTERVQLLLDLAKEWIPHPRLGTATLELVAVVVTAFPELTSDSKIASMLVNLGLLDLPGSMQEQVLRILTMSGEHMAAVKKSDTNALVDKLQELAFHPNLGKDAMRAAQATTLVSDKHKFFMTAVGSSLKHLGGVKLETVATLTFSLRVLSYMAIRLPDLLQEAERKQNIVGKLERLVRDLLEKSHRDHDIITEWESTSPLCAARVEFLKLLTNRLVGQGRVQTRNTAGQHRGRAEDEGLDVDRSDHVVRILLGVLQEEGDTAGECSPVPEDKDISPYRAEDMDCGRLRLVAASCLLKLARVPDIDAYSMKPGDMLQLGLVLQDPIPEIRNILAQKIHRGVFVKVKLALKYASLLCFMAEDPEPQNRSLAKAILDRLIAMRRQQVIELQKEEKQVDTKVLPEGTVAYLIYFIAHHPGFQEDRKRGYSRSCKYLDMYLSCLLSGQAQSYQLLVQILDRFPAAEDCTVDDTAMDVGHMEDSSPIHEIAELAFLIVRQKSDRKKWKGVPFPGKVLLPGSMYRPRQTGPARSYLKKGFRLPTKETMEPGAMVTESPRKSTPKQKRTKALPVSTSAMGEYSESDDEVSSEEEKMPTPKDRKVSSARKRPIAVSDDETAGSFTRSPIKARAVDKPGGKRTSRGRREARSDKSQSQSPVTPRASKRSAHVLEPTPSGTSTDRGESDATTPPPTKKRATATRSQRSLRRR